jgi:uncharacterized protein (DUF58 family)
VATVRRRSWQTRLLALAERHLPALTRLRQPEALPLTLHRKRIYILPTRFGLFFAVVVGAMLLTSLNYGNNPALLLTFLIGAIGHVSLHQTFRNLNRLSVHRVDGEPVHAGQSMRLRVSLAPADARPRKGIRVCRDDHAAQIAIAADGVSSAVLEVATARRGWLPVGRFSLETEMPFGLFVAWSWVHPDTRLLVYPRAETGAPPLPDGAGSGAAMRRREGEELEGVRDHQRSDPLRLVAWKASARAERLLSKDFRDTRGDLLILDFDRIHGLDREARIARLARWVLDARSSDAAFLMRLPGEVLGPGHGAQFCELCLRALALLPGAGDRGDD